MGIAGKYNRVLFNVDTKEYKYVKLSELFKTSKGKKEYIIDGIICHNSPLGESAVFIVSDEKWLVNLPQHFVLIAKQLLGDEEALEAIKERALGFTVYEYEARGRKCYSVRLVDI